MCENRAEPLPEKGSFSLATDASNFTATTEVSWPSYYMHLLTCHAVNLCTLTRVHWSTTCRCTYTGTLKHFYLLSTNLLHAQMLSFHLLFLLLYLYGIICHMMLLSIAMDPAFESRLLEGGVGEDVIKVLKEQKVLSLRIFRAMKE